MPRNGLFIFEHFELLLSQFLALSSFPCLSLSLFTSLEGASTVVSSSSFPLTGSLFFGSSPNQRNSVFGLATLLVSTPFSHVFCLARKLESTGLRNGPGGTWSITILHRTQGKKTKHYGGNRNREKR
ncbi:hypothetical protein LZ32DRAFT_86280 [Colletotrichum eremochloae]|nr:hypothetical protein LZ32DRAFT_86280 [Colletotrichum eremochloae]